MCKLGLKKGRRNGDQIVNIHWIMEEAKEFQKRIKFCFIDCAKAFDCVDHNKLWKILKVVGIPDQLRNLYAVQDETESAMEKLTGPKLGNEYDKVRYCHPAYLISMWNTLCEMPCCRNHKLESRLPGEKAANSDIQMIF